MSNKSKKALEPEILENLPEELREEARSLPPEVLMALSISIKRSWSAPLPPPEVFNKYPKVVQQAIVAQAEAQMKHRHKMENKVVSSNISSGRTGMTYAFWITTILIGAGVLLIATGHSTAGLFAIFTPTAFVGGNFIIQKLREIRKIGKDASKENDSEVKLENE